MIVALLLGCCVVVDYAANTTNETTITSEQVNDSVVLNDSYMVNDTYYIGVEKEDKVIKEIVTEKPKLPIISITCRPSCGCGRHSSYTWRTRTFINYCPHCHKYGTLRNVHKWPARHEQELTCDPKLGGCGADYCGNCGHEKYSWSKYYLKKA